MAGYMPKAIFAAPVRQMPALLRACQHETLLLVILPNSCLQPPPPQQKLPPVNFLALAPSVVLPVGSSPLSSRPGGLQTPPTSPPPQPPLPFVNSLAPTPPVPVGYYLQSSRPGGQPTSLTSPSPHAPPPPAWPTWHPTPHPSCPGTKRPPPALEAWILRPAHWPVRLRASLPSTCGCQ